jgi:thioredoxin-like negative regulator of GroEL
MNSPSVHTHTTVGKLFFTPLLLLLSLSIAHAQGGLGSTRGLPENSGGSNIIQGHVIFPEGQSNGKRLRVTLESTDEMSKSTQTDEDGTFRFNSLKQGAYTVVVEGGKDYETVRESVFFEGSNHNNVVPIYLKPKGAEAAAFAGVPKSAVDLYKKAQESEQKNDHKKAVELLSSAVAQAPNFAAALKELGTEYLKLNDANKASESLGSAVKLTPQDVPTRLSYGIALMNQKKFAEAEPQLRQVIQMNNAMPTAHMYLGIVLLTTSRDEKTRQYDMAKYTEAQKELEIAVTTGKDDVAMAHRYLGGIYAGNRDYKRGADELETYLKLVPKAPDAERIKAAIKDLRSKQ